VTCGDRRSEQVTIAKLDGQRTALTAAILDS